VTSLNDIPLVTLVNAQFTFFEGATGGGGAEALGGASVSDVDEDEPGGTGQLRVTVTVRPDSDTNNGTVSATASGAAVVLVTAPNVITIQGTEAEVNATLATLAYTAPSSGFNSAINSEPANPSGNVFVVVNVNDLGNTGSDGPKTSERTMTVTVVPVNDAPEFSLLIGDITVNEDEYRLPGVVYPTNVVGGTDVWRVCCRVQPRQRMNLDRC